MIEQFTASRRALEDALGDYLQTFRTVRKLYVDGQPVNTIHPDLTAALVEQFSAIDSFKETLDLTKRVIGRSMNASSTLTPIHGLPHEILSSIFEVTMYNGPHAYSSRMWHQRLQKITSVCSHWRRVTLGSPGLWTHIDFLVKAQVDQATEIPLASHLELAKVYEQRAAQKLLDVHIIDHNKHAASSTSDLLATFVSSIAPRVRSFALSADEPLTYRPVLSTLFNNSTLGKFTTLAMDSHSWETHFIGIETQPEFAGNTLLIDVPKQRLDKIYAGITVLELCSLYPRWTSTAYDGLTELRLSSHEYGSANVTELQLMEVLRRSPRLRVFECAIKLECCLAGDELVDPIPLNELEVLSLGHVRNRSVEAQTILRWLAPGPKPFQLLIGEVDFYGPFCESFLARSNITKLYLKESELSDTSVMHSISHLPNLHTMVLAQESQYIVSELTRPDHHFPENMPSSLETLYVIYHHKLELLHKIISIKSLRRIIFFCCDLGSSRQFLSELSLLNPEVELRVIPSSAEFHPVDKWEVFSLNY